MQSVSIHNEWKTSCLRVYRYERGIPAGTLENAYYEKPLRFENLMELLRGLDALLDEIQYPGRALEVRRFSPEPPPAPPAPVFDGGRAGEKPIASFRLQILFRQNASWQGNLIWLDTRQEIQFRSALELCKLLDEALSRALPQ